MIAENYADFQSKLVNAITESLNLPENKGISDDLLKQSLEKNPKMTPEEWSKIKADFLVFIFAEVLKRNKSLNDEFCGHLYKELRRQ